MAEISGDPIGQVREEEVSTLVQNIAQDWQKQKAEAIQPRWWQFWQRTNLLQIATQFMLEAIDKLINYVEGLIPSGPDKKATVLAATSELYNLIIRELIPIWLRPVAAGIQKLVITIIVPLLIDFMVKKYKISWNKGENENSSKS